MMNIIYPTDRLCGSYYLYPTRPVDIPKYGYGADIYPVGKVQGATIHILPISLTSLLLTRSYAVLVP